MSTLFYKRHASPKCLKIFYPSSTARKRRNHRRVEIWSTTCIVTNFGGISEDGEKCLSKARLEAEDTKNGCYHSNNPCCSMLINPSNPQLSGVRNFPYFPKGGPVPLSEVKSFSPKHWQPLGYVTSWGGMDVGDGMMYAVSVVDGMVHQVGGLPLQLAIKLLPVLSEPDEKCPVGQAVKTDLLPFLYLPGNKSSDIYFASGIIHTTPPFYKYCKDGDPCDKLRQCYRNSLDLAFSNNNNNNNNSSMEQIQRVAVPLLGAGCRGFPLDLAVDIAAAECVAWLNCKQQQDQEVEQSLVFGIPDYAVSDVLIRALENHLASVSKS